MDEREAISRLRRGDIGGLEVLVRRYQTEATQIAQVITRDRALAEDVVQSAFVRVYERIEQFDCDRPFAPWFFRIISNDAIKAAQRSRLHVSSDSRSTALIEDPALNPEEIVIILQQVDSISEALQRLSPAQRSVIVSRYYLGLNDREIAQSFRGAPGTIRVHLHAARKRLRQILSQSDAPLTSTVAQPFGKDER